MTSIEKFDANEHLYWLGQYIQEMKDDFDKRKLTEAYFFFEDFFNRNVNKEKAAKL